MAERQLTTAEADALTGTTHSATGIVFKAIGDATYYTEDYQAEAIAYRILGQLPSDLRVFRDGVLTYGVNAGSFLNGVTIVNYAGASAQALSDDATNYIYLTPAGALTKNTTGFPTTPHVPLAEIVAADAAFDADSGVTDRRDRAAFAPVGGATVAAGAQSGSVATRTITCTYGAWRTAPRIWIATSDYGAPSAANNTVSLGTGTILETITANADYRIISDASGVIEFDLAVASPGSRYIMLSDGPRIYSSGEVAFT